MSSPNRWEEDWDAKFIEAQQARHRQLMVCYWILGIVAAIGVLTAIVLLILVIRHYR